LRLWPGSGWLLLYDALPAIARQRVDGRALDEQDLAPLGQ
jgi:hypothetical protein